MAPPAKALFSRNSNGSGDTDDKEFLIPEHMQNNARVVHWIRQYVSIVAGCVAGVLGLTNVVGFLVYPLFQLLAILIILSKTNSNVDKYFMSTANAAFGGFFDGAMTYLLFWTFVYDIAHLF